MVAGEAPACHPIKVGNANNEQHTNTRACSRSASARSSGCIHSINCCSGGLTWPQVDSLRKMHGADKGSWGSHGHQTVAQYYEYYRNSQMTREKSWRPSWHINLASPLRVRRNVSQISLLVPAAATNLSDTTEAHYVGPVGLPSNDASLMQAMAEQSILSRNTSSQLVKQNMLVQVSSS